MPSLAMKQDGPITRDPGRLAKMAEDIQRIADTISGLRAEGHITTDAERRLQKMRADVVQMHKTSVQSVSTPRTTTATPNVKLPPASQLTTAPIGLSCRPTKCEPGIESAAGNKRPAERMKASVPVDRTIHPRSRRSKLLIGACTYLAIVAALVGGALATVSSLSNWPLAPAASIVAGIEPGKRGEGSEHIRYDANRKPVWIAATQRRQEKQKVQTSLVAPSKVAVKRLQKPDARRTQL